MQPQEIRPLGEEHDFQERPGNLRPALVKDKVPQGVGQALPAVAGEGAGPVGMAADDEFDASRRQPGRQGLFPGRIDLGLPVAGSLDDPQFSYGSLVWKAITNVLKKIVTAPFRALGALFGGGGEQLGNIVFEAGAPQLTPPEREKVTKLAEAMAKRPGLVLAVGGVHVEADRVALQDLQLRRAVLAKAGQQVPKEGEPGPVSTQQPKIREALEALYKERVGTSDLAALKEGFRNANPGQLEESAAGKMMSRLSGLLREKKTLGAEEVAQLKGADFYAVLFERLRAKENIPAERLQALAQARGEGVAELLKKAGVAAERVQLLPPEAGKIEGDAKGDDVPLRMSLEPAKAK